ncbi:hypothetical protein QTP88_013100 [Uroleucon formosanum]
MSQVLTGHGCFQQYLHSKAIVEMPDCVHCPVNVESAEHTIFDCPFWKDSREDLTRAIGRAPRPNDVMDLLCSPMPSELPEDAQQRSRIRAQASKNHKMFSDMGEEIMGQESTNKTGWLEAPKYL